MTEVQYHNLLIFAKDWRKYQVQHNTLTTDEFRKVMQYDQYIKIDCIDQKKNKPVLIYFMSKNSKYAEQSHQFKKIISKITDPSDVIIVMENNPKLHITRAIISFHKHLSIFTYKHQNFSLVVPLGPLCYKHRILEKKEVYELLNNELFCNLVNLPKILVNDVQCIWIGAEIGDVVEITNYSDINGEYVYYRVVVGRAGRMIATSSNLDDDETQSIKTDTVQNNKVDNVEEDPDPEVDEDEYQDEDDDVY
jgi:DNA-directed RNA polymerase subunit H (RpoH/RPB5)